MDRRQVVASAVSAAFIFPLVFLVLGALRTPGEPPPVGLEGRQLVNSGIVALLAVPGARTSASAGGAPDGRRT